MNKLLENSGAGTTHFPKTAVTIVAIPSVDLNIPGILIDKVNKIVFKVALYCSLKHPAKYIGKKPRKYTIPAKPLGPQGDRSVAIGHQASDQVRIYKETSPNNGNTSGVVGGLMHLQKYQRVRTEPLKVLSRCGFVMHL